MKNHDKSKSIKVKLYKNKLKSADKAPYLGRVVPNGEAHLDDILQEVAKNTGWTLPTVRMYYNVFLEQLKDELQKGNKVKTALGTFEPAISGTVPYVDSPLDPKKNKVYIKVTPPAELRNALAKVTPIIVGPESDLAIREVFTGSLGAKGYNVVKSGESFVVTGDGFQEGGELAVAIKDANGVSHAVTVEARKKTALVCSFAGTAAKGKATLEAVLAGEEPDAYRFTASRKVTVR